LLTVVVPTYERNDDLDRCLSSIRKNSAQSVEILVPHPGSDAELDAICIAHGAVSYIDGSRVDGKRVRSIWGVINDGIDRAKNRYAAWLNDDCVVLPDWDRIGLAYFRSGIGLVVLKAKGIGQRPEYTTIHTLFGITCANYAILDRETGIRFDERFDWFHGDADISIQATYRRIGVAATAEPCVDHRHVVDERRMQTESNERTKGDRYILRVKWATYARFGARLFNFRLRLIARLFRKLDRMRARD
jgi:glycosyltransferase involved in cell wall biosynthesis